ncbi:MAG: hypothetical protein ACRC8S_03820 [Fimbriiglobus sp.]
MTYKATAIETIQKLPDDAGVEEMLQDILIRHKIEQRRCTR